MTYAEKLESPEWQSKRIEILNRDNHQCQRCGFKRNTCWSTFIEIPKTKVQKIEFQDFGQLNVLNSKLINVGNVLMKTNLNESDIQELSAFLFSIQFGKKIRYDFNGSVKDLKPENIFLNDEVNSTIRKSLLKEQISENTEIDKEGFYLIKESDQFIYSKLFLHVHHKCYRRNVEIWEQEYSEYVTLCNLCHRIVHDNQTIPYFDELGNEISNLIPCKRCSGQRYFECYKNVQDGVCFRCNGYGFEF